MEDIENRIKEKLLDLEKNQNIRIIYACESGSRAWGFASADSDYDVRFIYIRPLEEYLKLEGQKDFIEAELNEVYDINGWDIAKFLKLLAKSNPVIFEWADSPIVYKISDEWNFVKEYLGKYFQVQKMMHHYVSMAKNNVRNYFSGSQVKLKKYLYVLRPALACEWIMTKNCPPPTNFSSLVKAVLPSSLTESVQKLLDVKMKASEKEYGPHIPEIDSYIEEKIAAAEVFLSHSFEKQKTDWGTLNKIFLKLVK